LGETYGNKAKFTQVSGHRVCYIDEGSGRPLLLVHGLGGTMTNWAPTIDYFKERYRVIALDLPAYGESEFCDADYGPEFFAGIITGLLEQLGIDRVTVFGHSLGGLITLHLALDDPGLVEEIVLVDSAGGHRFSRAVQWGVRRLPARWIKFVIFMTASYLLRFRWGLRVAGVYHLNPYTKALIDYQIALADRPDLDGYLEAYYRTTKTAVNVSYEDRLGDVCQPTLIVWGQKDGVIPPSVGRKINKKITGSFLVSVPRAAHVPQLDQPELFNRTVERFLLGSCPLPFPGQDAGPRGENRE
jgi:pimeloyl-ACP methyl ester carboxylesterase